MSHTHLRYDGGDVHAVVVLPPVQAALCCHFRQVNIHAGQQTHVRKIPYSVKFISGALAGHPSSAAALQLQRDAAVHPCGAEVDVRGNETAVFRRVGEENDAQGGETGGDGDGTEEEKNLLLETAPFPEEGGCSLVVGHVVCTFQTRLAHKVRES